MCCGQPESPLSEIVMAREVVMPKKSKSDQVELYTTAPGSELTIGGFGRATNTRGVMVPADQVESLTAEGLLSTEPLEEPNTRASRKAAREGKEK